jgi:two-component system response regulator
LQKKAVEVLLVDDNPGDILLTKELLAECRVPNVVHEASNGAAALQFLCKEGCFTDAPSPDLVILDLNMPGMSGLELLRKIREDPLLACLPVLVLSSSDAEEDIQRCYELHANCYVTKPGSLEQFCKVIRSIDDFWLAVVRFPRRQHPQ